MTRLLLLLVLLVRITDALLSPIIVLGSKTDPNVCVGVQISPQHILVRPSCAESSVDLATARVLDILEDNSTSLLPHLVEIDVVNTTVVTPSVNSPLHVLSLGSPLPSDNVQPVILPLQTPYPAALAVNRNATLVQVDVDTMRASVIHNVIYVDDSRCPESICALPLTVEARKPVRNSDGWSFLLQLDVERDKYWLLGLGSGMATDIDGIWGFTWLPQLLTSSLLTNNGIHGVHTVTAVHKELDGKKIKSQDSSNEFVAALSETQYGVAGCTGTLIASRYVLTAVSCFKLGNFQWVVMDTLVTYEERGERIKIKRRIPNPRHVDATHWYDFMLLELENPVSYKPIKYLAENITYSDATVFGFGEFVTESGEFQQFGGIRSNSITLYPASECAGVVKSEMDETLMCTGYKTSPLLCAGDNGGPVVLWSSKKSRQLYAIVSGGDCGRTSNYGIVSVVYTITEWIQAYIK
ncbi:hypothetical protein Poli38472_011484 [Pythium oligandrum]|uniref:Peptidase S1 domain-containing protein n=1 Tax=Pythium oligandrum TaxID=41045 RepID=A0A8K1FKW1_PYTOL|nr:hypothetical protein Poli38472_011484 [Pythium oligandrum]|eukprot:TMW64604.1 hypothetical protein Poli38472_011484 [Pythium oligandrum]